MHAAILMPAPVSMLGPAYRQFILALSKHSFTIEYRRGAVAYQWQKQGYYG